MKYAIEIISAASTNEDCLSRAIVDAKDLGAVKSKASFLIHIWADHGAIRARVFPEDGQKSMEIGGGEP
jgi:hypothetical protein